MPSGNQIPIGIEDRDTVPCGCAWEDAMVEGWLVLNDVWDIRQPGNGRPQVSLHLRLKRRLFPNNLVEDEQGHTPLLCQLVQALLRC